MFVQAPVMHPAHHHQFYPHQQAASLMHPRIPLPPPGADSPTHSSSRASSQQASPNRTPPLPVQQGPATSFYLPVLPPPAFFQAPPPPLQQQQQTQQQLPSSPADHGYSSQHGSITSSPVSSASSEHQQHVTADQMAAAGMLMQHQVHPLLLPFGLPIPFAHIAAAAGNPQFQPMLMAPHVPPPVPQSTSAHTAQAAVAAAFLQHQQALAGCPVFEHELPDTCRLHSAAAYRAYNFGSHIPPFDLVRWYSEKPPFILDGRTACLYKMREIDRKLPTSLVLSADAEYNTVLAEYYILRNMFGPDYSLHDNVFIKLNRSKEGELAKFIHIFFRERQDAEVYMTNAHKFGALTPAWSNPRAFSRNNVYITSVPYYLLSKESLCAFVREFVLGKGATIGSPADPIKRARVDAEKRSAQVEFHRGEDAEALIAYFYRHIPEANARPAFDNNKEQRSAEPLAAIEN